MGPSPVSKLEKPRLWPMLVFLVTLAVVVVLLAKVLTSDNPSSGLIGAVVVLIALMILIPRIPDIDRLRVFGMSAELRDVKQELADTQKSVAQTSEGVKQELADTQKEVEAAQA